MNTASLPVRSTPSTLLAAAAAVSLAIAGSVPAMASEAPHQCWTPAPGVVGDIDHPTDPEAVVLRMFVGGGFVPREFAFLESPTFTLYGNNVAIFRVDGNPADDITDPLPPFACAALTPEQVDELLTAALDDAGLRDADERYENPFITDVPDTVFTIDADGVSKTVVVQGLGFEDEAPDEAARADFRVLADALEHFGSRVDDATLYEVPAYESILTEAWPELEGEATPWPWPDISPEDYLDGAVVTLTPQQVSDVAETPNGGQAYILLQTGDGERVSLTLRPVLPPTAS